MLKANLLKMTGCGLAVLAPFFFLMSLTASGTVSKTNAWIALCFALGSLFGSVVILRRYISMNDFSWSVFKWIALTGLSFVFLLGGLALTVLGIYNLSSIAFASIFLFLLSFFFYRYSEEREPFEMDKEAAEKHVLLLDNLRKIDFSDLKSITVTPPNGMLIKSGDVCHFSCWTSLMEIKTVGYRTEGTNFHLRIRIFKGLSWGPRSGTRQVAVKGMTATATGEIALLQNRLVFLANNKASSIPYSKILGVNEDSGGVKLLTAGRQTPWFFSMPEKQATVFGVMLRRLISQS
jgi:hypothetical protein